jgi:hypothetical protein
MASATKLLYTVNVTLTDEQALALKDKRCGIMYTWGPESQSYRAHISNYDDRRES